MSPPAAICRPSWCCRRPACSTLALVQLGEPDRARAVLADRAGLAIEAERAWGDGAAAALAMLRLAEGRLTAATDPAAAVAVLDAASSWPRTGGRGPCWWLA